MYYGSHLLLRLKTKIQKTFCLDLKISNGPSDLPTGLDIS